MSKVIIFFSFLLAIMNYLFSQEKYTTTFEGSIWFTQETATDTNEYAYTIYDKFLTLDILEGYNVENFMLFDLEKSKIIAFNPSRKLFINVPSKQYVSNINTNFKIIKTKEEKIVEGYSCFKWIVRNVKEDIEIEYYVSDEMNFSFYIPLLKLWNRSEKHSLYFLRIPNSEGFFPLLTIEKDIKKDSVKMKLYTTSIQKIDTNLFSSLSVNDSAYVFDIKKYRNYDHKAESEEFINNKINDKILKFLTIRHKIHLKNKIELGLFNKDFSFSKEKEEEILKEFMKHLMSDNEQKNEKINRKEEEITKKEQELASINKVVDYQKNILYLFGAVFILVLLLIVFIYRSYRNKKKSEKLLSSQKHQISEKNEELNQQNEELQSIIEELNKTQHQLVESEKMASLGNLVAGVAHEINTPVGIGITASSSLMDKTKEIVEKYKQDKIKKEDFESYLQNAYDSSKLILSNLERTGELVQSFKQVSVDQAIEEKREFNFGSYLHDVVRSVMPKLKNTGIELEIICPEDIVITSYPGAFAQILTNLIVNSKVHAYNDGDKGKIEIKAYKKDKELILEYTDDGKGMTTEVKEKIFDPFFTTNKQEGTGLGMHIVYNLVTQKLNGKISCESEVGKGVKFIILIPEKL